MSTQARGRLELRRAVNAGPLHDSRVTNLRITTKTSPIQPPRQPSPCLSVRIPPLNSLPTTPRASTSKQSHGAIKPGVSPTAHARNSGIPSPRNKPKEIPHRSQPLPRTVQAFPHRPVSQSRSSIMSADVLQPAESSMISTAPLDGLNAISCPTSPRDGVLNACEHISLSRRDDTEVTTAPRNGETTFASDRSNFSDSDNLVQADSCQSSLADSEAASSDFPEPRRKTNCRSITLSRSVSDNFQRRLSRTVCSRRPSSTGLHFLSLDDASLAQLVADKKKTTCELKAQRKLKALQYGRKPGNASRVATDVPSLTTVNAEPERCKFITAQSDQLCVAYHDQEWGVPVHDDRKLFELLFLAGAQAELSWTTILHKREVYRSVFRGYEPTVLTSFGEKHIQSLESDKSLLLPVSKIRGVVENARRVLEVVKEFGSLNIYFWHFLNYKPMVNKLHYPKQLPAKTSKSEFISKDLVKRGFRFVGPTIVYSFMQAAGMTNDHLLQCFRHKACILQVDPFGLDNKSEAFSGVQNGRETNSCDYLVEGDVFHDKSKVAARETEPQIHNIGQQFIHTELTHIEAY